MYFMELAKEKKKKSLNIVKGKKKYWKAVSLLRDSLQIGDYLFDMIENMVCKVYGF